jgi:hypothetical protein
MELSGPQVQALQDALLAAFTRTQLERMVRIELGQTLDHIVGEGPLEIVVFRLITEWAEREGKVEELIWGASRQNKSNPKLNACIKQYFPEQYVELLQGSDMSGEGHRRGLQRSVIERHGNLIMGDVVIGDKVMGDKVMEDKVVGDKYAVTRAASASTQLGALSAKESLFTETRSLLAGSENLAAMLELLDELEDEISRGTDVQKIGGLLDRFSQDQGIYIRLLNEILSQHGHLSDVIYSTVQHRLESAQHGGRRA